MPSGSVDQPPFRLFVVAGEASGDTLAAHFIEALRKRLAPRRVDLHGIGGPALAQLGLVSRFQQTDIQLMGVIDVLKSLPTVLSRISETTEAIEDMVPDLLLTVDVPDFAMRVARKVRKNSPHIPIIHWVAPTVWAWRPGRARAMKPHTDRLLALLPFEPEVFRRLDGPPTTYVGHPLLDVAGQIRPDGDEQRIRDNAAAPVILVLPGSRRSEIKYLMPVFRDTLRLIAASYPHAHFVIPAVPHLARAIADHVTAWGVKAEVVLGEEAKRAAFRRARVALAASGTVTLELALAGIPLVGAYRGHPLEAWLAGKLVTSHSVLMCNLVLQQNIAPEFMQNAATSATLAGALLALIPDAEARRQQVTAFARLDSIMMLPDRKTSGDAAVDVAMELLGMSA
jgi:lipid-A-disaccharide synthase